ncbi:hypothetical protein FKW77_007413 [Venturia effusa]|uniref:Opsin-1 n=1 Tax=Venturia effusa TaxID=50376 RepID=A0A517KZQ0_9PEZI|nr:hypothetical protein FKW77_007413 [Venturia effusa]
MMDPMEIMKKSSTLLVPTSTGSGHPKDTAFPTVVPDLPEFQGATQTGIRTLWVVFVVMVLASAAFAAMSWTVKIERRLYHVITTLITITAAISYFGMATKAGVSWKHDTVTEHHKKGIPPTHHDVYRQVYWARYVDWAITTPLLLVDLMLLAGMNGGTMFMAIVADLIMIITGLFAAYGTTSTQKWGWYAIACIAYLVVIWHLVIHGRAGAFGKSSSVGKFFAAIAGYTLLLWTAYPIVWGIADGSRIATVDQEIIAYAVLDILAKPVFGAWLLTTHAKLSDVHVDLGGFWSNGLNSQGRVRLGDDDEGA